MAPEHVDASGGLGQQTSKTVEATGEAERRSGEGELVEEVSVEVEPSGSPHCTKCSGWLKTDEVSKSALKEGTSEDETE